MTLLVQAKIHIRNCLCWTVHQNQQEWTDVWLEATKAINNTKIESCKGILHDAMSKPDGTNMWKVIQDLIGTPDTNSPNESMSHNGCTVTSIKTKANILVNHYGRVSQLNMPKADHDLNRHLKKNKNKKNPSTLYLLTMKVVLHFKWASCCLPLKRGRVKEQQALTTFLYLFLNNLVFWPSRNYYPYLIHFYVLLTAQKPGSFTLFVLH